MSRHEARASLLNGQDKAVNNLSYYTGGGYHEREGYAVATEDPHESSKWLFAPSKWQWTFLGTVVVQAIVGLALEGFVQPKNLPFDLCTYTNQLHFRQISGQLAR